MNKLNALLFVLLITPVISMAKTYTHHEHGYSIDIDDSYRISEDYDATFFEAESGDRFIVIRNRPGLTEAMARDYLLQGYQDHNIAIVADSGSKLTTVEIENGKALRVDIQGIFERRFMKGVAAAYIGNEGQGLVVLVSAAKDVWDGFAAEADKINSSLKFIAAQPSMSARDWYHFLAGTRLVYRGAAQDNRQKEYLSLCSDGDFIHRKSFAAMRDSESAASMGYSSKTRSGLWEVVDDGSQSRLLLFYNDGNREAAVIEDRDGHIYLNGRRYKRQKKNNCR